MNRLPPLYRLFYHTRPEQDAARLLAPGVAPEAAIQALQTSGAR